MRVQGVGPTPASNVSCERCRLDDVGGVRIMSFAIVI